MEITGRLIKQLRDSVGLTQDRLANLLGVKKPTVSQWEHGYGLSTDNLLQISDFFGVSVEELIRGKLAIETDDDAFRRNYDLSIHEDFSKIESLNRAKLCDYLDKAYEVQRITYELLYRNWHGTITSAEGENLRRLLSNYRFDFAYLTTLGTELDKGSDIALNLLFFRTGVQTVTIKEDGDADVKINEQRADYVCSKAARLNTDLDYASLLNLGDPEITPRILRIISKTEKDSLLTNAIGGMSLTDVRKSNAVKSLLESGAEIRFCLGEDLLPDFGALTREQFESLEFEKYEHEGFETARSTIDAAKKRRKKNALETSESWRLLTEEDYRKVIDLERTEFYRGLIKAAGYSPTAYLEYLKSFFGYELVSVPEAENKQ